jgi:LPS-assembly protein
MAALGLLAFFLLLSAILVTGALAQVDHTNAPLTGALNPPGTISAIEGPSGDFDAIASWPEDQPDPGPFPDEVFPTEFSEESSPPTTPLYSSGSEPIYQLEQSQRVRMVVTKSSPEVIIEANEMRYDRETGRLDFIGNVIMTRGEEEISGHRALWHEPTQTAEISGDVKMRTPDFIATAARAAVNMDLKLAKLYAGKAFFPQGHYYVKGDIIERHGEEAVYVNEAVFTTCDGPEPSWRLKANDLLINRKGLATASGVSFSNKWFPMFYAPYFAVPIKGERQTGFLIPNVSHSKRDGFFLATPFFWELAEDYDLTITPVWRSKRGLAMTLEGRYNLNIGQGIWLLTYLKDKQNNTYSYRSGSFMQRNVKNLYWLRSQNSWNIADWNLNLDIDMVSDPMFLYSFRNDIDGFKNSQSLFTQYFGRTVNEELDPIRLSTFFAQKTEPDAYFRGSLSYSDNLYRENNVDTLQNLPKIQYHIVSRPVGLDIAMPGSLGGPRFSLAVQYDYFTRYSDDESFVTETGHRMHVNPSLFWNHDLGSFMNLKVDAGGTATAYFPNGMRPDENGRTAHKDFDQVLSANVNVELTTSLSRIYDFGLGNSTHTLHQLTPVLAFELVEAPSQAQLPFFDMLDRRLSRQTFRYGLRNTITTKTPVKDSDGNLLFNDYRQLFKLGIYSSYEFANNIKWAENSWARYYTTGYYDRGVGPFEFELESFLAEGMSARLFSKLDGRSGKFTRHEISMNLNNKRGDYLGLIYDYDNPTLSQGPSQYYNISQIRGDIVLNLTNGWSTNISSRYDFERKRELESYFTLNYSAQCYGLSLFFASTYDDSRIGLVFNFLGLGSFGTPTTSLSSGDS